MLYLISEKIVQNDYFFKATEFEEANEPFGLRSSQFSHSSVLYSKGF